MITLSITHIYHNCMEQTTAKLFTDHDLVSEKEYTHVRAERLYIISCFSSNTNTLWEEYYEQGKWL